MSKARIAVLIPAYKPDFFEQTLLGLYHQTFKEFDVYVSDDSFNEVICKKINHWQKSGLFSNLNITKIIGPKNAWLNHRKLDYLYSKKYEFIHFLMDDDYIYPTFYEQHLAAHSQGDFSVSVSQRWLSDEKNTPIGRMPDAGFLTKNVSHFSPLEAHTLSTMTLPICYNWLGELSNMMFRPEGKPLFELPPKAFNDMNYFGLHDIGTCLRLVQRKPLVFISSFHSNFRQHATQTTHSHRIWGSRSARLCWASFALASYSKGFLDTSQLQENLGYVRKLLIAEIPHDQELIEPLQIIDRRHATLTEKITDLSQYLFKFFSSNPHLKQYLEMIK